MLAYRGFLQVKQWHWSVTHKDNAGHVKKALLAIFRPIEKLGGKHLKDADRMGKVLGERILGGAAPQGLHLV